MSPEFIVRENVVCCDVVTARQALKLGGNQQLMIASKGNSTLFWFLQNLDVHKVGLCETARFEGHKINCFYMAFLFVEHYIRRKTLCSFTRGFFKELTLGKLAGYEVDLADLVELSRGKCLLKKFDSKSFPSW